MAKSIKLGSDTYLDASGVVVNNSGALLSNNLNFKGRLVNGADLNSLNDSTLRTGFYSVGGGVINSAMEWCMLINVCDGTYGTFQIEFSGLQAYFRAYTGSPLAWTAWKRIQTV